VDDWLWPRALLALDEAFPEPLEFRELMKRLGTSPREAVWIFMTLSRRGYAELHSPEGVTVVITPLGREAAPGIRRRIRRPRRTRARTALRPVPPRSD
jgi:hypothetical protein